MCNSNGTLTWAEQASEWADWFAARSASVCTCAMGVRCSRHVYPNVTPGQETGR